MASINFKPLASDRQTDADAATDRLPNSLPLALARSLLKTYGSPLYVYDGDRLQQTIQQITQAVPYAHTQFRFASVTNGNIALLQIFRSQGWGLHANTPGDIYLGLQAGFLPTQIVYSGSNLDRSEMAQVLDWGVTTLNLDSLAQLELLCEVYGSRDESITVGRRDESVTVGRRDESVTVGRRDESITVGRRDESASLRRRRGDVRVGLRLNLPELTGDSRIGVRPGEFAAAVEVAARVGLLISGLHFYRGTGTNATQAFTQVMDTVLTTAQQLPDWQYLDFGGGFGYPYRQGGAAFDWPLFGRELTDRLQHGQHKPIELVIEPGRAAIAGCAVLLATVVAVKWQDETQVVGVDTTVANLAVPSVHGGYREIVVLERRDEIGVSTAAGRLYPTNVCGNTTYSRDYLGKNCQLPALKIGDIIAILDVGAYGYAMSSHFLHRPRPAEVLLEQGQSRLIRQREDYQVLLNHQVFTPSI
jgi:diaminopimelate decarboxylase